jgi:16S rRNA (cytidine1402-2'-O)-methyltransferase
MAPAMGALSVVATPIGNLDDLSLRASRTLREADIIYAEDTRRSRVLLEHLGVVKRLESLHEHNERERTAEVLGRLGRGEQVALLTDAGTPAVSDPGALVVARAREAGFRVTPIAGPSALSAALSVSGFAPGVAGVLFLGFLPARGQERRSALARALGHTGVVALFEAPHRLARTLEELARHAPERHACVARELTKIHEELRWGLLHELAAWAASPVRGEITLVLDSVTEAASPPAEDVEVDRLLERCLDAGLSPRDAASAVSAVLERPRREVYARCQALRLRP